MELVVYDKINSVYDKLNDQDGIHLIMHYDNDITITKYIDKEELSFYVDFDEVVKIVRGYIIHIQMNRNYSYTKDNFYVDTFGNFDMVDTPNSNPDFISRSDSKYWYTSEGVIRYSDHWGQEIRSCSWYLENKEHEGDSLTGFCKWEDFRKVEYKTVKTNFSIELVKQSLEYYLKKEERK